MYIFGPLLSVMTVDQTVLGYNQEKTALAVITSANVMSSTFIEWVGDGAFVLGFVTGYGKYTLSPREKI